MNTRNFYTAPEVETVEVVTEQGIAFSNPSNFDIVLDDLGDEQGWD